MRKITTIALLAALALAAGPARAQETPPMGAPPPAASPNAQPPAAPQDASQPAPPQAAPAPLPAEALDQLLGPVALYPDPLLAQVLAASTQPEQVALAARFVREERSLDEIDSQRWDASVKALARYPDVLRLLDERIDWTAQLGDAFAAQPADVMDSVQRLRARAQAAGNLETTPEQRVVVEEERIQIVPASTEVVYVPVYEPAVVYVHRPAWFVGPVIGFHPCGPLGIWLNLDFDWRFHSVWYCHGGWRPRPPHVIHEWHGHAWRPPPARRPFFGASFAARAGGPSRRWVAPPPARSVPRSFAAREPRASGAPRAGFRGATPRAEGTPRSAPPPRGAAPSRAAPPARATAPPASQRGPRTTQPGATLPPRAAAAPRTAAPSTPRTAPATPRSAPRTAPAMPRAAPATPRSAPALTPRSTPATPPRARPAPTAPRTARPPPQASPRPRVTAPRSQPSPSPRASAPAPRMSAPRAQPSRPSSFSSSPRATRGAGVHGGHHGGRGYR